MGTPLLHLFICIESPGHSNLLYSGDSAGWHPLGLMQGPEVSHGGPEGFSCPPTIASCTSLYHNKTRKTFLNVVKYVMQKTDIFSISYAGIKASLENVAFLLVCGLRRNRSVQFPGCLLPARLAALNLSPVGTVEPAE